MDIITLGQHLLRALPAGNNTTDLPIKIIEAVVPGYGIFTNAILHYLGLDISALMSYVVFCFIAKRVLSFLWFRTYATFLQHCTSYVHIEGSDDLYGIVIQWIAATRPDLSRQSLTARTQFGSIQEADDEDADVLAQVAVDNLGYFNFNKWAARVPPSYEPHYGNFWFSCRGKGLFHFTKSETVLRNFEGGDSVERAIMIRCVGFNTNPIKALLADMKSWSVKKQSTKTAIRIPAPDRYFSSSLWTKTSERPSRPLDTVILDPVQKDRIQRDMNEYLHPLMPNWYAARGIPYRRGYLFHGPPGTGKTSLSFALAGIFGLDIHIIALMDPNMTESYLNRLFNSLPKRCIVLLEDIDSAGVQRAESDDESDTEAKTQRKKGSKKVRKTGEKKEEGLEQAQKSTDRDSEKQAHESTKATVNGDTSSTAALNPKHENGTTPSPSSNTETKEDAQTSDESDKEEDDTKVGVRELAKAIVEAGNTSRNIMTRELRKRRGDKDNTKSNISLSGLLNAIDGVATHEGRILIMTTNHVDRLDSALIRAGRVDMQIQFTNATTLQIRHLFIRMYTGTELHGLPRNDVKTSADTKFSAEELEGLATLFAEELPEEKFAPSDIQGYLLLHKKHPRDALAQVGGWRDKKLKDMMEKEESEKNKAEGKARRKKGSNKG